MSCPTPGTRLLLVRHGQSTWNADGRWQGQADPPLSPLGEHQAADAAVRVEPVEALWTSDLVRARRTADIVAQRIAVPVRVDRRLRERDAGPWQGHTRAEIDERWPGYLETGRRPAGFEPDEALLDRVLSAIEAIADAHSGQRILVVTHGGIVRTLERHLGDATRGFLPNLGGRFIDANAGGGWVLGDEVLLVGDEAVTRPGQI